MVATNVFISIGQVVRIVSHTCRHIGCTNVDQSMLVSARYLKGDNLGLLFTSQPLRAQGFSMYHALHRYDGL
jgi:hypothetical protein